MSALEPTMQVLEAREPSFVRHRLTVDEYYRMAEAGVLAPEARVELIEGEIIDMAPMGTRHHNAVMRLNRLLILALGEEASLTVQLPVRLSGYNEPEPDFAVLRRRDDGYSQALPTGRDCLLVIEIADTTLAYDLRIKAPLYARHGVAEYWVLDLEGQTLHRHSRPQGDGWQLITVLKNPGRVALPGVSDVEVDLSLLLS